MADPKNGGGGELLLIEPKGDAKWLCLGRPAKRMNSGDRLIIEALNKLTI